MSFFDHGPIEPYPALGSTLAFVWVLVVGGALSLTFGFSLWHFVTYRARARRAASISGQPPALAEGPALLSGKVETEGGGPAVRLEIDQVGTETKQKNGWSHVWRERHRGLHAQPFRLRVASSEEVVTVVPDERIRIVDDLATDRYEGTYRRRVAELSADEKVWVSGVLAREGQSGGASTAYRTGPAAWVLRGTRLDPLEVSSGKLDRQFSYWRRFHRTASIALGVVWLLVHVVMFGPYYALYWTGKVERLAVTRTSTYITTNKNTKTTHYVIHATLPRSAGGREVKDEVRRSLYEAARLGAVTSVPFRYCPALPFIHSIGEHADLSFARAFLALMAAFFSLLVFFVMLRNARPWYEQRAVVERGTGRLSDSAWRVQVAGEKGLFVDGRKKNTT